jgi:hypothetical protein
VEPVTLRKPARIVVRQPHPTRRIFPSQRLERQIDADRLDCLHQRRARGRIAEDQQLRRTQGEPGLRRARRMIDPHEDRDAAGFDLALQPVDGRLDGAVARNGD